MKRYLVPILSALAVVALYSFVNINLFTLDIAKKLRESYFILKPMPYVNESLVVINSGTLEPEELLERIDSLLLQNPKSVGINLCHFSDSVVAGFVKRYNEDHRVVIANCYDSKKWSLSSKVNPDNTVTHFKTDRNDYFELTLSGFKNRGNATERIAFEKVRFAFYLNEFSEIRYSIPNFFKNKIVLIGYVSDDLRNPRQVCEKCRVTPVNEEYGQEYPQPDMNDFEISAIIVKANLQHDYYNEIGLVPRVLLLLLLSVINVLALTFIKTRWLWVNIIIAFVVFILLILAGTAFGLYLFVNSYYIVLDELPLILLITTVFTVSLNIFEKKKEKEI